MEIIKPSNGNIIISQEEYETLIQNVQITSEFLQGKSEKFKSSNDLIANLKKL